MLIDHGRYETRRPWPSDCLVQGGSRGLVVARGTSHTYRTAFVEAFPRNPDTFIRGEGPTMADAEDDCWAKLQRMASCPGTSGHEYEARGYRNGAGFCRHCGMFASDVFDVAVVGHPCAVCGVGCFHANEGELWYCKAHWPGQAAHEERMRRSAAAEPFDDDDIAEVLERMSAAVGLEDDCPPAGER